MSLTRRALLVAGLPIGAAGSAVGAPSGPCLVWRDGVAAFWRRGADPLVLPADLATAPVPTASGVWLATSDARLQRWIFADGWQRQADAALPAVAHALAASGDGQAVIVACDEALLLHDARAALLRHYEGRDLQRRRQGRAGVLRALPHRRSLLAAWPALGEWWEISLDRDAPPLFEGLVHDYRMGEGLARPGHLGVRRLPFDADAPRPAFTPEGLPWVAAQAGQEEVAVVHLDVRRTVARLAAPGLRPEASVLHAGLWWLPAGDQLWGLDPLRWTRRDSVAAPGPVRALASADGTLWALAGSALHRWTGSGWTREADGVSALASCSGARPLAAPEPWQGVAAWH